MKLFLILFRGLLIYFYLNYFKQILFTKFEVSITTSKKKQKKHLFRGRLLTRRSDRFNASIGYFDSTLTFLFFWKVNIIIESTKVRHPVYPTIHTLKNASQAVRGGRLVPTPSRLTKITVFP